MGCYINHRVYWWFDDNKVSEAEFKDSCGEVVLSYLHREDGPAFIFEDRLKEWYHYGKLHRVDGPAIEHIELGTKSYYLWGKEYTKEDYDEAMKFLEENGRLAFKMRYML